MNLGIGPIVVRRPITQIGEQAHKVLVDYTKYSNKLVYLLSAQGKVRIRPFGT